MKILFVSSYFGYKSGFNRAAGDILYSLLASSHEIAVLTHYRKIQLPEVTKKKFLLITAPWNLSFPEINNLFSIRNIGKWLVRYIQDIFRSSYEKKVHLFSPDIIIINSYSDYLLPNILSSRRQIKIFISHTDIESIQLNSNKKTNIENTITLLANYDYIVFVSKYSKNDWTSFEKVKKIKSFYIPNCADEKQASHFLQQSKDSVQNKIGFNSSKFNVVCVANIMPRKGQDFIIDNIEKIIESVPNINIYFVGDAHTNFALNLKKKIKLKGLSQIIHFCGVRRNAMEYIYGADMFLLPSRAESLPLVILESMILNTPILASNVSGIPEMIIDGQEGYLFSLDNFQDFASKLEDLYVDPEKRDFFAKNANNKYWEFYSRAKQIINYSTLLSIVAKSNQHMASKP